MAYIGFDLDETLGRFAMAHFETLFLQPHIVVYEGSYSGRYGSAKKDPPIPLTPALKTAMDNAFDRFIACIAEKEREGLGLLRPGIVEMAKTLYALKQSGKVKSVVIYSNNGNLALLHLAGRLIELLANAPGLFCNFVHWYHPLRHLEVTYGKPGMADKTFRVLLEAFQSGTCEPAEISRENIFFFDDVSHFDIFSRIPKQYFKNPAYRYDADPAVIVECFKTAFIGAGLDKNQEYFEYISDLLKIDILYDSLEDMKNAVFTFIDENAKRSVRKTQIPNNTTFRKNFNSMFPRPISKANFQKSLQTLQRLEQRLNRGETLSNQETQRLSNAQSTVNTYELQNPNLSGGKRPNKTKKQKRKSKN